VWKFMLSDWIRSRPLVNENTVFATTLDGKMYALRADGNKGKQKWVRDVCAHGVVADLVGNSKGILACGKDGILYSVSPRSGEVQWKHGIIDGAFIDGKYVTADWGGGGLLPTPTVVDGVVYLGGADGFVNAIDVNTGSELWRFETKSVTSAAITVGGDKVFFGSLGHEPEYYALDRKTGDLVWESSSYKRVWVGASYNDERLVFGTMDGMMYGADALTGKKIWEYNIEQDIAETDFTTPGLGIYSIPAFDNEFVYMGSWIGYYMAFDQSTGKMKWKCRTFDYRKSDGRPDSSAPVLWKNHLYVQKLATHIAAINVNTGEIEWQWKAPYGWIQNGTVAAFNDKIFGSAVRTVVILPYGCRIYAFNDVENGGGLLWEYEGGGGLTAPVGTDDKLIFGSSGDAHMTCLDPEDGSLKWRVYTGEIMRENVPAIYGNKVIAHFMNGWLLAIE
jgi:outer membrane protein assembly factor BamB